MEEMINLALDPYATEAARKVLKGRIRPGSSIKKT